jgi:hypothetical protein
MAYNIFEVYEVSIMDGKKIFLFALLASLFAFFGAIFIILSISPTITLNGDSEVVISVNSTFLEPGATALINNKNATNDIKINGNVDTSKIGVYEITYTIKNGILSSKATRIVNVVDDLKPEITLNGGNNITLCPNESFIEPGYTAIDNYDSDITDKVIIINDGDSLIYSVIDSYNNEIKIRREINKIDIEQPVLTLNGNLSQNLVIGTPYYEKGFIANDNCDGNITNKVKVTGNVDVNKIGTYKIKYDITDSSNNNTVLYRTINIVYPPAPKNSTIYLTFDDGPSSITSLVLDILKEENVKATFFVLDKGDTYNHLMVRMVNEGHTIGLHGHSHNYYTIYQSVESYFNDLSIISNKVKQVTGVDSNIIRFVGGSSNTVSHFNPGIMTILTNEVTNRGYLYYD